MSKSIKKGCFKRFNTQCPLCSTTLSINEERTFNYESSNYNKHKYTEVSGVVDARDIAKQLMC